MIFNFDEPSASVQFITTMVIVLLALGFRPKGSPGLKAQKWSEKTGPFLTGCNFNPQNFAADDLISVLATRGTNCPDKSIPNGGEAP